MRKYICILFSLCTLWSCNDKEEPSVQEDYDQLFPFTGVDKPVPQFGQIVERQGDINLTAKTFRYLGTKSDLFQTEYDVELTYLMWEDPYEYDYKVKSRIALRFVNEEEQLVSIGSDPDRRYMTVDEYDNWDTSIPYPPIRYRMPDGREQKIRFKVKSGFQLLLCLTGNAPTGTKVRAEIVAKATDGSYPPIKITAKEETQGGEGQASIPNALCKYIILP